MDSALKILMSFLVLCSAEGFNQKRTTTFPFQEVYNDDPNYKNHNLLSPSFNTDYVPNHKRNNETHTEIIFVNHQQAAPLPDSFPNLSHFEYEYDYPWEDIKDHFDANENYIEQEISTRPPTVAQNIQELFFKDSDEPVHFAPIQKANPRVRGQQNFRSDGAIHLNKHSISPSRPGGFFPNFPSTIHPYHPILTPQPPLLHSRGHISPQFRYVSIPRPTPNQLVLDTQPPPPKSSAIPQAKLNSSPNRKLSRPAQPRPKLATLRPSKSRSNPKPEINATYPTRAYLPPPINQSSSYSKPRIPPIAKKTIPKKSYKSHKKNQVRKPQLDHITSGKKSILNWIHPYSYSYKVRDDDYLVNFGATEESDGKDTQGEYYVSLPDGRLQIVRYSASNNTGYQADVSYQRP